MRRYWHIAKGNFMAFAVYPHALLFTLIGNIVYMIVVYFLWKQIFSGADTLHGMTFNETFIYLTLAGSVFILFKTFTDWNISYQIRDGSIITRLMRPLDFQWQMFAQSFGFMLFNGTIITIPSLIIALVIFRAQLPVGVNLLLLPVSLVLAFFLSFMIDYMTGLTSFYTESLWGISASKEVIITALSGALIPLQFFPEGIQHILRLLPFQAIYNIPLQMATSTTLTMADYVQMIGIQLVWVIVFMIVSRLFYRQAIKVLTVNGG